MEMQRLQELALEIKDLYRNSNQQSGKTTWDARAYADGLVVDVAALMKMLMIHDGLRDGEADNSRIAHELGDIVWSTFVIADELGINLAEELPSVLISLRNRFE